MGAFPNDYVHDQSDKVAKNLKNRTDRTATYARFTPVDDEYMPCGHPVEISNARTRVTSRWTGDADPEKSCLLTATVDDPAQCRNLPLHKRYQIEIWTPTESADTWIWRVYERVHVSGILLPPGWAEFHGYVQLTRMTYEERGVTGAPPVWIRRPSGPRS